MMKDFKDSKMINMKFPIIDLKDIARAYLAKGVCKHSGEGSDPSINYPRIQLQHTDGNKMQFGILHYYYPAAGGEYEGADGTKYGVWVPAPHPGYEGSLPEGVTMVWHSMNFAPAPFPGTNLPTLFVYEVDLTVAKTFSLGFTNPSVRCVKDGQTTATETFPTFRLTVDFAFNGDNGLVKYCNFPLDVGGSFKIEDGMLALGDTVTGGAFQLPKSGVTTPSDENSAFAIYNSSSAAPGGPCIALHNAGYRTRGQIRMYATKGGAFTTDILTSDDTTALVLDGYSNTVSVGFKKINNHAPIEVVDKLGANMAVYVLGENCEWVTATIDGVQRKVLMAKA